MQKRTCDAPAVAGVSVSADTLLGGRVRYAQLTQGYRTGLEPVLLAASVPAQAGDAVLEAGTGAGAGLLCLAARVACVTGLGLERAPEMAALAAANFAANGFGGLRAEQADLLEWVPQAVFDHAMANPPWHDEAATASPDGLRDAAKRARPGLLAAWTVAMAKGLRPRGTLSLILPAASLAEGLAALTAAKCPEILTIPLWKRQDAPAGMVILRGIRLGRGPCQLLPGLALHQRDGSLTDAAEDVLRRGSALP